MVFGAALVARVIGFAADFDGAAGVSSIIGACEDVAAGAAREGVADCKGVAAGEGAAGCIGVIAIGGGAWAVPGSGGASGVGIN